MPAVCAPGSCPQSGCELALGLQAQDLFEPLCPLSSRRGSHLSLPASAPLLMGPSEEEARGPHSRLSRGAPSRGPCSPRGRVDTRKRSHTATVLSPSPCWQAGALLPLHKPTGSFLGGRCWGHRLAYSTDPAGGLRPGGPAGPSLHARPACSCQHTHRLPPFPLP